MMKLNGKVYLSYTEVECEVSYQLRRFSTSQHSTPPQGISYIDAEFVTKLKTRSDDIVVALGFLYKTENYIEFNEVVSILSSFFYDETMCDSSLSFLTAQLTESQNSVHRAKYYHYLFNILVGEVIKFLISKFV